MIKKYIIILLFIFFSLFSSIAMADDGDIYYFTDTDVTLTLSGQLIGIVMFILLLIVAEWKSDVVYYIFVAILGLPFGVYLLANQTTAFDIFLGVVVLFISLYTTYLFLVYALRYGLGKMIRKG